MLIDLESLMLRTAFIIILIIQFPLLSQAQKEIYDWIAEIQEEKFFHEQCLDFIRTADLKMAAGDTLLQIIIVRHGEPAMEKKGWRNRDGAIRYTQMYDSVGVYDFDSPPICLKVNDPLMVYTSCLPRAINTAQKTLGEDYPKESMELFNEFERRIINFPNIKLPMKFWSVTTRLVWMMGFNHGGIESFSEARKRAKSAAQFLHRDAQQNGKTLLFAHGFLNRYIKKYLKEEGYVAIDLEGQKYLGAYYFYQLK